MIHKPVPATPSTEADSSRRKLIGELARAVRYHRARASFDAALHQMLVITATLAGFAALAAGLYWSNDGWRAGILGVVPSLAAVFALRLHCVQAARWQRRMADGIDGLSCRLEFEGDELAAVSKDLRMLKAEMLAQWEKVTAPDETMDMSSKPLSTE